MSRKGGLGKGLGSLISSKDIYDVEGPGLITCPIDKIRPNPRQPRTTIQKSALEELAESIRRQGLIQPLVVREEGDGYLLIAGERRWRAAQMAGLTTVPVVVKDVGDIGLLEMALVENIQREDLNPMEEAAAYRQLMDEAGLSQKDIARQVGKNRVTIANTLRLLSLPEDIQQDIMEGRLSAGHARAILMVEDRAGQRTLRDTIIKLGMSVRQAEGMARRIKEEAESGKAAAAGPATDPDMEALCQDLSRIVGARVRVRLGKRGGKVEISCRNRSELERFIELIRSMEE